MPPTVLLSSNPLWWCGVALMGFLVGFIAGMFGVGGNFLLIPLLNVVFKVPLEIAVGTGLCQVTGTALAALVRFLRMGQGETKIDWIMLAGGLLGARAGAEIVAALSEYGMVVVWGHAVTAVKLTLSLTFVVLLVLVSAAMLIDVRRRPSSSAPEPGPVTRIRFGPATDLPRSGRCASILTLAYLGLFLGFISGLVGMGGGIVMLPIMMYGIGMRVRMAAGTGIILLAASAMSGTWSHAMHGHVHLGLAMSLLLGSTIGAPVGATATARIDGRRLRGLFAGLILLTAAAVLWDLCRVMALHPVSDGGLPGAAQAQPLRQ